MDLHSVNLKGANILVQVSGGPDSIFLLHALGVLSKNSIGVVRVLTLSFEPWENVAVSIVRDFCKQKGYIFRHLQVWISKEHRKKEALYRAARLRFVRMWVNISPADFIFLAHHQDDLLETQLLKMFRGGGTVSLQNAQKQKNWGKVVRPLLQISKKQIISYLQQNKIPFFMDPGNQDSDNRRNILRLQIFPQMDTLWGSAWKVGLTRSFAALSADAKLLQSLLFMENNPFLLQMEANNFSFRPKFLRLPFELQQSIVHKVLRKINPQKDFSVDFITQITSYILNKKKLLLWDQFCLEKGFIVPNKKEITLFNDWIFLFEGMQVSIPFAKVYVGNGKTKFSSLEIIADSRHATFLRRALPTDRFVSDTRVWLKFSKGKIPTIVKKRFCWVLLQKDFVIAAVLLLPPSWEKALQEKGISTKIIWQSQSYSVHVKHRISIFIERSFLPLESGSNTLLEKVVFENGFDLN